MTQRSEPLEATTQLERARIALGEALGRTQEIQNDQLDVDEISSCLARAVREIFAVQSGGVNATDSLGHINRAMEHMRQSLVLLQDARTDDPVLTEITGHVAQILALLYPVSKSLERISQQSSAEAEKSAPKDDRQELTVPKNEAKLEPIIPLVKRRASDPQTSLARAWEEKRRAMRHEIRVDIGIYSDSNFFAGFTQDISTGGIFVATYDVLPIGSKLNVNFNLPEGPVVSIDGTVRWIREYNDVSPELVPGMGVQFDDLSSEDRNAINAFMIQYPPIFYDDE